MRVALFVLLAFVAAVQAGTEKDGYPQPCFPPGYCPNYGTPLPVAAASVGGVGGLAMHGADGSTVGVGVSAGGPQVVLQSNAVDVETDGGFVISLPSPPVPTADLPEFSEQHGPYSPINKAIADGRNKIVLLMGKIAEKKKALQDHETWLEQATRAVERVKKQVTETKLSAAAIKHALTKLEQSRKAEVAATKRARLARELQEAQAKLSILAEQHARVKAARQAIQRRRRRVSRSILDHGRLLNWHNEQLKSKIQQFEDDENDLAHIGQTPYTISHVDRMLEDDEIRRTPNIA